MANDLLRMMIRKCLDFLYSNQVWDKRCLNVLGKPAGVLMGHLEGVSFIDISGNGRYFISNGKDQTIKLWGIRKMSTEATWYANILYFIMVLM